MRPNQISKKVSDRRETERGELQFFPAENFPLCCCAAHLLTPEIDRKQKNSPLTVCLVLQVARVRRAQRTGTGAGAQGVSTRPEGVASPLSKRIEKQWRLSSGTQCSFEERARQQPSGLTPTEASARQAATPRERHERDAPPGDLVILYNFVFSFFFSTRGWTSRPKWKLTSASSS